MRGSLEKLNPKRVEKKVSTKLEVARYLRQCDAPILFEKIEGYEGFRVAGNLCSSREVVARVLEIERDEITDVLAEALDKPSQYNVVSEAAFLKNSVKNPDLMKELPLVMYYSWRERYYTSATIVLCRDPDTGRENASFHRMMHLDGNRFAVRIVPRDLYNIFQKNRERGEDTRIVVVCGVHTGVALAAATSYPNLNELKLANTLMKKGLKCVQVDGIDVPCEAEVVMAGRILRDEVADEGPFVDLTGTWDAIRKEPVFEVERLYLRDDPIWQVILPGGAEHRLLMGLPQEPRIFRMIQNSVPSVKSVVLTTGGCCWLHAVVSIKKRVEGDGKNAGLAALSAHPSLKRVIVVDDDIDASDTQAVEWALATRLQPDEGIILIPKSRGSSLDPSTFKTGVTTKWIIDATIPLDRDRRDFMKAEDLPAQD